MSTKGTRNLTVPAKIFMVLACACATGFMWRARGSRGWSSMWGMFSVGMTLIYIIYAFFGNRRKMRYESIPFAVILMGITVGGWGTLNSQMSGYLYADAPFLSAEKANFTTINPYSGLIIMLLLGFSWMPLFAMFIGSLFSKKDYKIWHYAVLIGVFYVIAIACQFSVSHYILPKICPEASEMAKQGLADRGISLTPMAAYIKNLGSAAYAKKIPFCRNYFTSIVVISRAIAALAVSLTALIAFKDKVTAMISTGINIVSALAITLADFTIIAGWDRSLLAGINIPDFFRVGGWTMWEFLTGFFIGFGIMLILVCLPKKLIDGEGKYKEKSFFENKTLRYLFDSIFVLFLPCLLMARCFGLRLSDQLCEKGYIKDDETLGLIILAVLAVISLVICLLIGKKNILKKELQVPVPLRIEDYCMKAAPIWFSVCILFYYLLGDDAVYYLSYSGIGEFKNAVISGNESVLFVTILSVIGFYVFFFAAKKCSEKKN